jgi:hypothetical protein
MESPTKQQLYETARELDIDGRSAMDKEELARAVRDAGGRPSSTEPPERHPTGNWVRDHLLSIILLSLFVLALVGQYYFQYEHEVNQALQHGQTVPEATSGEFLNSFLTSVFENWQSEFLQLVTFVVLATYFIHRGSPQSRDGDDEMAADIKAIRKKLDA